MRFSRKQKTLISVVLATVVAITSYTVWRLKNQSSNSDKPVEIHAASKFEELKALSVKVGPSDIEVYIKAPGIVDFHPKHALRIHPAFPGVVVNVQKQVGDRVNEGDALATIESNVGIQVYNVTSPIKGVVLSKNIGSGQSVSPEDELFSVGDGSVLQARMAVSARDINLVKAGQEIVLLKINGWFGPPFILYRLFYRRIHGLLPRL
jgi:cobalt-zinc-cadmium efflux system membrane fusion protein